MKQNSKLISKKYCMQSSTSKHIKYQYSERIKNMPTENCFNNEVKPDHKIIFERNRQSIRRY